MIKYIIIDPNTKTEHEYSSYGEIMQIKEIAKEIFHVDLPISVRIENSPEEIEEAYKLLSFCSLMNNHFKEKHARTFPTQDKNILQTEMVLENVTVEILTNPVTGETEIGWHKQPNTKDVTDSWYK